MKKYVILTSLLIANSFADQFEFEQPSTVAQTNNNNASNNSGVNALLMINRQFTSINAVVVKLQSLGFDAYVSKSNASELSNQVIAVDGTIKDFINQSAKKFNYGVDITQNKITFTALSPAKPVESAITADLLDTTKSATTIIPMSKAMPTIVKNNWSYSSNDKYISVTFARWAKQANYQLIWKAENDFEVQSSGNLTGGFKTAINDVLASFKHSEQPLMAEWYKNNVVVITNLGN